MKNNVIRILVAALLLAVPCVVMAQDAVCQEKRKSTMKENFCQKIPASDLDGIREALDRYVGASIEGDSNVAKEAFAEGATISHAEDGELICLPIATLYEYYDETGKQPASYEINDINLYGDVAVVTIDSLFGDTAFVDMFSMVKGKDGWKIVSKIFKEK